jgi:hypothetical protein
MLGQPSEGSEYHLFSLIRRFSLEQMTADVIGIGAGPGGMADARSIVEQVQDGFSFIPKPRQHSIDGMAAVDEGWMLDRAFEPDFASPSVNTLFGTQTDRRVTDGSRVTGVRARRIADGAEILVQAWGGVILATGSYQPALAAARCSDYPNARLIPGRRGQPAGRRVARRSSRTVLAARHCALPIRLPREQLPISAPKRRSIGARRRCLHAHSVSLAIEQRRVLLPVQAETAVT